MFALAAGYGSVMCGEAGRFGGVAAVINKTILSGHFCILFLESCRIRH